MSPRNLFFEAQRNAKEANLEESQSSSEEIIDKASEEPVRELDRA